MLFHWFMTGKMTAIEILYFHWSLRIFMQSGVLMRMFWNLWSEYYLKRWRRFPDTWFSLVYHIESILANNPTKLNNRINSTPLGIQYSSSYLLPILQRQHLRTLTSCIFKNIKIISRFRIEQDHIYWWSTDTGNHFCCEKLKNKWCFILFLFIVEL